MDAHLSARESSDIRTRNRRQSNPIGDSIEFRNPDARRVIRIPSDTAKSYGFGDIEKDSSIGSKSSENRDGSLPGSKLAPKPKGRPRGIEGRALTIQEQEQSSECSAQGISSDKGSKESAVRRGDSDQIVDQKSRATSLERIRAQQMFREIGKRFNENRKKSKSSAYEQYQRDLMENASELVIGEAITLKELTTICTDLESYMRDTTGDQSKTQADLLSEWLRVPLEEITILAKKEK